MKRATATQASNKTFRKMFEIIIHSSGDLDKASETLKNRYYVVVNCYERQSTWNEAINLYNANKTTLEA